MNGAEWENWFSKDEQDALWEQICSLYAKGCYRLMIQKCGGEVRLIPVPAKPLKVVPMPQKVRLQRMSSEHATGWECPRCHSINAPSVLRCVCAPPCEEVSGEKSVLDGRPVKMNQEAKEFFAQAKEHGFQAEGK